MFFQPNMIFNKNPALFFFIALTLSAPAKTFADPNDQSRWDKHYNIEEFLFGTQPIQFLKENIQILPKGRALDLAM